MADEPARIEESPEGAAVFPLIPPELGVHPLLLAALHAYVADAGSRSLAPRTMARRLSAMRQFYRFLRGEGTQTADPTVQLDAPRLGRPLPKILAEDEVERLARRPLRDVAELECQAVAGVVGAPRQHCPR